MIRFFKIDASQKQYVNLNIHDLRIDDLEDLYEQNMPFHFSFPLSFFFLIEATKRQFKDSYRL